MGLTVSVSSIILVFALALQPQANAFGGNRWWSYVLAVFTCLLEASCLTLLALLVVQSKCRKKIFVKTMILEGKWKKEEMIEPSVTKDINCCRIGFLIKLITLPLNVVPVIGTIIYAFINAPFDAWDVMDMYFDAISMDNKAQKNELAGDNPHFWKGIYSNKPYNGFGFAACLLETIPIFGPTIFSLGNACGAALWACEMEKRGGPFTLRESSKRHPLV